MTRGAEQGKLLAAAPHRGQKAPASPVECLGQTFASEEVHGMQLGERGMQNQVRQWARQSFLADLLDGLLDRGFTIWLTSDHGNIEAVGCGSPGEGAVADTRGERVRTYSNEALRDQTAARFPEAHKWPPLGLLEDYLPLLAPGRRAFVAERKTPVCHGGASIEEVIVPLVRIARAAR